MTPAQLSQWADVPQPLAELVFNINARAKKCSIKKLRANGRDPELVRVRWAIARAARHLGYSYPVIGRALNRDHTSIMYAVGALRK